MKKKAITRTAFLNFDLGWNDYIHPHITPILTYLRSSLKSSLQNRPK